MTRPTHTVRQAVTVHGIACELSNARSGYRIARADSGAELARAATRFHAIAKAAVALHTPARSATQGT